MCIRDSRFVVSFAFGFRDEAIDRQDIGTNSFRKFQVVDDMMDVVEAAVGVIVMMVMGVTVVMRVVMVMVMEMCIRDRGVVTINLVDVACSAEGDMDRFWAILEDRLELCHRALRCRHERLLGTKSDVAPILWQHGALARLKKGETIDKLLFDGYSTISLGYAGLCEMCVRMIGKSHTSPEGQKFALSVMQKLNDKCQEWKAAERISYSVYGTPMESTTYRLSLIHIFPT